MATLESSPQCEVRRRVPPLFEIATGVVMASYRVDAVNAEVRPLVRAMRLDLSIGGMLVSMSEGEQDREAALTRREADVERREADLTERLEAAKPFWRPPKNATSMPRRATTSQRLAITPPTEGRSGPGTKNYKMAW